MSIRSRRKASKRREKEQRNLANQQMAHTTQMWDQMSGNLPTAQQLDASVKTPSLWSALGSQAGRVNIDDGTSGGYQAQNQSVGDLSQISREGYTDADRTQMQAAQQSAQMAAQQSAAANRQSVMQQAAARGQRNGGLAMMGALQANQGSNNAQALANMQAASQLASNGQARRLAASQSLGAMGGQMRAQDLQRSQAQIGQAQAVDAFNQNRAQSMDAFNQYNAGAGAAAQQQAFGNQMGVTQGATGAYQTAAGYNAAGAQAERDRRNQALQMFLQQLSQWGGKAMTMGAGGGGGGGGGG